MLTNLKQCGLAEDTMAVIKLVSLNMSITTVLARITSNALQNSFSLMGKMSMVTSAFNDARWYDFGHSLGIAAGSLIGMDEYMKE